MEHLHTDRPYTKTLLRTELPLSNAPHERESFQYTASLYATHTHTAYMAYVAYFFLLQYCQVLYIAAAEVQQQQKNHTPHRLYSLTFSYI